LPGKIPVKSIRIKIIQQLKVRINLSGERKRDKYRCEAQYSPLLDGRWVEIFPEFSSRVEMRRVVIDTKNQN